MRWRQKVLDIVSRPDALRITHEGDWLAAHVLTGEGRLGAQLTGAVDPRHLAG